MTTSFPSRPPFTVPLAHGGRLLLGDRCLVMGILNVTPDSFADSSSTLDPEAAVAAGLRLQEEGADLIDVGGESTRPGAEPISVTEELARILPVIHGLAGRLAIPISVDTYKADVARAAIDAGAGMLNSRPTVMVCWRSCLRSLIPSAGPCSWDRAGSLSFAPRWALGRRLSAT